ncbi:UNKNOWN [Stylonychia lemnae]|uniref:Uncharacterized protein n=1 Tax=Stylonychia lemnae TaxID=5949 RepID=A0A078AM48_STYLE|nr:UNKNOWN [Stylonychia lemnae]|eukprot:CDW82956.1 UNKNOWN [Stylonychia lemnae]
MRESAVLRVHQRNTLPTYSQFFKQNNKSQSSKDKIAQSDHQSILDYGELLQDSNIFGFETNKNRQQIYTDVKIKQQNQGINRYSNLIIPDSQEYFQRQILQDSSNRNGGQSQFKQSQGSFHIQNNNFYQQNENSIHNAFLDLNIVDDQNNSSNEQQYQSQSFQKPTNNKSRIYSEQKVFSNAKSRFSNVLGDKTNQQIGINQHIRGQNSNVDQEMYNDIQEIKQDGHELIEENQPVLQNQNLIRFFSQEYQTESLQEEEYKFEFPRKVIADYTESFISKHKDQLQNVQKFDKDSIFLVHQAAQDYIPKIFNDVIAKTGKNSILDPKELVEEELEQGLIQQEKYEILMKKYDDIERINREKKRRQRSPNNDPSNQVESQIQQLQKNIRQRAPVVKKKRTNVQIEKFADKEEPFI